MRVKSEGTVCSVCRHFIRKKADLYNNHIFCNWCFHLQQFASNDSRSLSLKVLILVLHTMSCSTLSLFLPFSETNDFLTDFLTLSLKMKFCLNKSCRSAASFFDKQAKEAVVEKHTNLPVPPSCAINAQKNHNQSSWLHFFIYFMAFYLVGNLRVYQNWTFWLTLQDLLFYLWVGSSVYVIYWC